MAPAHYDKSPGVFFVNRKKIKEAFKEIELELKKFSPTLARQSRWLILNKADLFDENEWKKFNKPSFKYADCSTCSKKLGLDTYTNTNGFFTEYSMTIPSEDMAEVYSHLITGNYKISDDSILKKKIEFIKNKLKEIDNTFIF